MQSKKRLRRVHHHGHGGDAARLGAVAAIEWNNGATILATFGIAVPAEGITEGLAPCKQAVTVMIRTQPALAVQLGEPTLAKHDPAGD